MSHISEVEVVGIKNSLILKSACRKLGLRFRSKKKVIMLDDYDLSFVPKEDGSYEVVADCGGRSVDAKKALDNIHQLCIFKSIRQRARCEGYKTKKTTDRDGTILLHLLSS